MNYEDFVKELRNVPREQQNLTPIQLAKHSYEQLTSDFPLLEPEIASSSINSLANFIIEGIEDDDHHKLNLFPITFSLAHNSSLMSSSSIKGSPESISLAFLCYSLLHRASHCIKTQNFSNFCPILQNQNSSSSSLPPSTTTTINPQQIANDSEVGDDFLPFDSLDSSSQLLFDFSSTKTASSNEEQQHETDENLVCKAICEVTTMESLSSNESSLLKSIDDVIFMITNSLKHGTKLREKLLPTLVFFIRDKACLNTTLTSISESQRLLEILLNSFKDDKNERVFSLEILSSSINHSSQNALFITFVLDHLDIIKQTLEDPLNEKEINAITEIMNGFYSIGIGINSLQSNGIIAGCFSVSLRGPRTFPSLLSIAISICSKSKQAFEQAIQSTPASNLHQSSSINWAILLCCYNNNNNKNKNDGQLNSKQIEEVAKTLDRLFFDDNKKHWFELEKALIHLQQISINWNEFELPTAFINSLSNILQHCPISSVFSPSSPSQTPAETETTNEQEIFEPKTTEQEDEHQRNQQRALKIHKLITSILHQGKRE